MALLNHNQYYMDAMRRLDLVRCCARISAHAWQPTMHGCKTNGF